VINRRLTFHPLIQQDFNEIVDYYHEQVGFHVADRFELEFREAIDEIKANPRHYPYYQQQRRYRRHMLRSFPHLILYIETKDAIRIMVVKHMKRKPAYGLRRR
jgi:plasmid stabilization system protein ParE